MLFKPLLVPLGFLFVNNHYNCALAHAFSFLLFLVRQCAFRIRKLGADQCVESIAEKFREPGETGANDFFNLYPRPLPPIGPQCHPAAAPATLARANSSARVPKDSNTSAP